jgi:dTDP-4-amino-4,6-dideoxygalactose transaminase
MMRIKMVDLCAQNEEIRDEVENGLGHLHTDAAYVGGPQVKAFEDEFASFLGVKRVVGVGSGTDALRLALLAIGIGAGDEVITSPITFVATAAAIFQTGARPVFVDVDQETGNISAAALRRYLEARRWRTPNGPRAIVPVHLYGMPVAMPELRRMAAEHGLKLIEDSCQAHGARLRTTEGWRMAGTMGTAGCFSFYPGKNLGAWGEAGAVATNDEELAARVALLRDHGRISHYAHQEFGYNSRLDAIQAVVLRAKLSRLHEWNKRRRMIADVYRNLLVGCELELPVETEGAESCYHLFVIRSDRRDIIREALLLGHIECGIHYPVPLHLQPACRMLGYRHGDLPASEKIADSVLSLPMHPHLRAREVMRVADTVRRSLQDASKRFDRLPPQHRAVRAPSPALLAGRRV